ncbi:hypothetical protein CEUSTIGMA_g4404.t1 [Chlamydomonas eustigma]|uniref:Right handed beta helix domain-containing protein n=1 Tax=Chlamydomonas eustigma TaxID=1157962 RepID=A0A250X1J7_9CHLO|nr:hypothetical protein CEUSTIGMA_g4404.t1 [Chlamydomonas eustigma]|eukprot:GAX76957.1 hypothetical protein CEUSTIGMA_g4404.t1 [Chlamydomonas eustigma]
MTFMMLCGVVLMGVLNVLKGERIDLSLPLEAVDPRQESLPITVSSPLHLNGQYGDMFKHRRHLEEIYTNSNVTNYTTLDCKGSSSALLIQSAPVVISNIIFTNCMATAVSVTGTALMGSITFINCTFINNTGVQGGAVYVSEAVHTSVGGTVPSNTVTFQGCVFINNSATKSPSMDWSTSDYDVSSNSGGGAVMIQNADVTPSNITEGCLALNSLHNSTRAQVIFERCTFSGNHASMRGGAVYALSTADFFSTVSFFGCKFTGNTADMGAAVYIGSNSELALANNCIVENNTPWRSSAQYSNYASCGAFCSPQSNNGVFRSIQNSVFTQNGGYVNGLPGGALSVSSGDQVVYLTNNTFSQNVAYQGGAIYISSTSEGFVLENSVFQNNTALMDGGAIYFSNVTNLNYTSSISNCSLAKNYAASDGGAICLSLTLSVEITSCNMWDNQAGLSGGALYSSRLSQAAITNTNFWRNSAMYGGAISGSFETTTSVLESTFSFNHATSYGGAIECSYCNAVILDRCVIKNNTCDGSGGGLGLNYLLSLNTSAIRDTIISGNIARLNSLRGSDLADSTSEGLGGGLALVMIQGFLIQNATFEYNMATNGGGAHISRDCGSAADPSCPSAIAQIDQESTFVANAAIGGNGGALMILTPTALSVECVPPAVGFSPSLPSLLALVVNGTGFPETGCPHWSRNYADPPPGNVMSSSVAMTKLVSVSENVDRYVSNTAFSLQFSVVDLWGQVLEPGCSSSNTSSIAAKIVDPRGSTPSSSTLSASLSGSTTSTSINGVISLNDITLLSPSGLRHIGFDFTYAAISAVNSNFMDLLGPVNGSQLIVTVNTRPCVVGEVAVLGGEACFNCSSGQYSFNPLNSTCDTCPQNADCGNLTDMGVVLPNQGYWHSHPFSVQFHPCSPTIACNYIERDSEITYATLDLISLLDNYNNLAALPNSSLALTMFNLTIFYSAQCAQGYYGIKCGGCSSGYGRVGTKGCFSCPSFAYNTLAFMAQYLVSIFFIFITIRTSLMKSTTPEVSEEGLLRSADLADPASASSSTLIRGRVSVSYFLGSQLA